ncbi:MAG: hypothetical protein ONA69_07745, partial [candidate division KSB1 bacterium]|nr:hypothetical protein [candidate division KSB1 bacterium]
PDPLAGCGSPCRIHGCGALFDVLDPAFAVNDKIHIMKSAQDAIALHFHIIVVNQKFKAISLFEDKGTFFRR